jgi:hypothetical protein
VNNVFYDKSVDELRTEGDVTSRTLRKGHRPWRGWCHGNVARIHVCVCKAVERSCS